MKTSKLLFAMLLTTGMHVTSVRAETAISVDFFYEHLEPHGSWLEMDEYGYVWQPHDVDAEWYPYGDGRWAYTDAGWTWVSNEPYGWAVYHYGRWSNVREVGWVWVPGTAWGPGWVSWRRNSTYVGWAPLPPEADFSTRIGFSSWVDRYYDIGPAHYRFVEVGNLGAPRLNTVFVDRRQNLTLIQQTTNITNISYRENVVFNGGPAYDETARISREPIPRYRLERRRELAREGSVDDRQLRSQVEGDTLRVADLPISASPHGRPPEVARKIEQAEVDRGWREVGSPEEVTAAREKIQGDSELPEGLPDRATAPVRGQGKGKAVPQESAGRSRPAIRPESAEPDPGGKGRMKGERPDLLPATPGLPPAPKIPGKEMKPGEENLPPEPGEPRLEGERPDREKGRPAMPPEDLPGQRPDERRESKGTKKDPAEPGTAVAPPLSDPGAPVRPILPVERPMQHPEERRESKGTMKDPAHPGTEVAPVPPAPAAPVTPRPPAPRQGKGRDPNDRPAPSIPPRPGSSVKGRELPSESTSGVSTMPPPIIGGSATPPLPPEGTPPGGTRESGIPDDTRSPERAKTPIPQRPAPSENVPVGERNKENDRR